MEASTDSQCSATGSLKRYVHLRIITIRVGGFNVGSEVETNLKYFLDKDSDYIF